MTRGRRTFTMTDLCAVVALVAMLCATAPGLAHRSREMASRVKCASNLRQIGQAIQIYANDNTGQFPRTVFDAANGPTAYTGAAASNPFGPGGPAPNDVTACLFLLTRTQEITPELFVCPSSPAGEPWNLGGKPAIQWSNFPGRQYLSYSYVNSYPTAAAENAGFKLDLKLTSDFALAADINPGPPHATAVTPTSPRGRMQYANSPNHNGDGQNVLYADGHVEFQNTPFCGMLRGSGPGQFRDNVYTFGAGFGGAPGVGVNGPPVDALDSALLPTILDGPVPAVRAPRPVKVIGGALAAVLAAVFLPPLIRRWRGRTTADSSRTSP